MCLAQNLAGYCLAPQGEAMNHSGRILREALVDSKVSKQLLVVKSHVKLSGTLAIVHVVKQREHLAILRDHTRTTSSDALEKAAADEPGV